MILSTPALIKSPFCVALNVTTIAGNLDSLAQIRLFLQYPMNFHCENCPPGFFVNTSFLLLHQNVSFFSRDVCVEIEAEFVGYHSVVAIPILSIAALGIILTFLSGGIIYFHRFTPIVKAAGREHLGILFIGIICTYAVNFVFLHQPSTWSCLVVRFLGTSYAICNSALLLKISRIYRIFNTREGKKTQKLKYISPKSHVSIDCDLFRTLLWASHSAFTWQLHGRRTRCEFW